MIRHLFIILVGCVNWSASLPGWIPGENDAAKDLAKMQGKWKLVEAEFFGKATKMDAHVIVIEKNFVSALDSEEGTAGKATFKLDPSKSPKEIDWTIVFNALVPGTKGQTTYGIYQIEGDELIIAVPFIRERPREFTTKKRGVGGVFTFKRMKP